MTLPPESSRARSVPLVRIVLLLWIALYLCMMGVSDWPWASQGTGFTAVLGYGTVPTSTMSRFGSAMPVRIHDGEWSRLFTGGALNGSLLSVLMLCWFFSSVAKQLRTLAGISAVLAIMLLGGAIGSYVHAWIHPDTSFAAPGPFGWIVALLGLQMGIGLFGKVPGARRLVGSTVFTLVIIGALTWLTGGAEAWQSEHLRPALGIESLGASFVAGLLMTALLGPERIVRRQAPWMKALAFGAVIVWCVAAAAQAPRTIRAASAGPVRAFINTLWIAERETRAIYDDGRDARARQREKVAALINRASEAATELSDEDKQRLDAYLDALRPIAAGDTPDPHARLMQAQTAFKAWLQTEQDLRSRYGISPRRAFARRLWTRP